MGVRASPDTFVTPGTGVQIDDQDAVAFDQTLLQGKVNELGLLGTSQTGATFLDALNCVSPQLLFEFRLGAYDPREILG